MSNPVGGGRKSIVTLQQVNSNQVKRIRALLRFRPTRINTARNGEVTRAVKRILMRKGLLTNEEVLEEIKAVRREMEGKRGRTRS